MDRIKQLYEGLLSQNKLTSATSFDLFKSTFNNDEDYRKSLYNGLVKDGDFTQDYDTFVNGYAETKNSDPSKTISQELPKSDFKLKDVSLEKELFQDDEEKKSGYRTYMTLAGLKTEKDTDGQYIKGTMGDIISMLPMGDFIDDQARAWGAGAEDRDVQEVAQEMMNSSKPTVEQAERMLNEMYQARTLPPSDEWKKFTSVLNENGGDAFAAVKAVYSSPSGAQEAITRSVSAMANWNNLEVAGHESSNIKPTMQ